MITPYLRSVACFTVLVLLQLMQQQQLQCTALLLQCPLHQMRLQKIVGFRPPLQYLSAHNRIYARTTSITSSTSSATSSESATSPQLSPPPRITRDGQRTSDARSSSHAAHEVPSQRCWHLCASDADCIAYVHLLDNDECYGFTYVQRPAMGYLTIGHEMPLVADAQAIFYEKTCLKVPDTCRGQLWTLTKIPGTSLVFRGRKTIPTLVTRRKCAEYCLFEQQFECLSASFAPSYRNNRERFAATATNANHNNPLITLGRCTLSDRDKMIQPDSFRAAPYDEEYMENQCHQRPIEPDYCSYELYANSSFIYAEVQYNGLTQKECQSLCTHETRFYCQGVSYQFKGDPATSQCQLHSEDIISLGPRSLRKQEYSVYMRRVKCLDVQVVCTQDEMAIKYTPKDWFGGKIYVSQHSENCMALGNGNQSTLLRLKIGNELTEKRCGILRAFEVTNEYQRIFISALVVIQHNTNVQTHGDRLIKVGCIMSNTNGNEVGESAANDDGIDATMPNAIALESSLEFTRQPPPSSAGSLHYNITIDSSFMTPKVSLQIVDLSHQHETNDVQIGQNLELRIVTEYKRPAQQLLSAYEQPPLPEVYATSLVAKTADNVNYVLLIDERGCPTDTSVFPALERVRTSMQNVLRARFMAFKFAGTSSVNFDVKIQFCKHSKCPESNCMPFGTGLVEHGDNIKWRKRNRRQLIDNGNDEQSTAHFNPIYISTVMDVMPMDEQQKSSSNRSAAYTEDSSSELPLNYNLNVHGPDNTNSKSIIYGERGILLIASIGDQLQLDNICLNQSLLLALLIFWLIFQVALLFSCCYVIQKYKRLASLDEERRKIHESFEEAGRRVHWADGSGYTL